MVAQAVSGPVLELILALFWTPRNRENRAPVEARGYFLQKSSHALGSSTSTPKWSNIEPQSGPKTSPGGLRRGTHAVPQRSSNLAVKSKRFWTILEPKRGSQMGPRIGQKSALAPKGHPEAARGPSEEASGGDQFWVTFGPHLGPILELPEADFRATAMATAATAVAIPTTTATATARASGPSALEPLVSPRWSGASAPLEPKPQPPLGLSLSSFLIKGLGL